MGFSRNKASHLNKHCIEIQFQEKNKQRCAGNLDAVVSQFWIPENAGLLTSGISDEAQEVGALYVFYVHSTILPDHILTILHVGEKKKRLGGFKHKVTMIPYKVQVLIHCPNQYIQKEVWHLFALHLTMSAPRVGSVLLTSHTHGFSNLFPCSSVQLTPPEAPESFPHVPRAWGSQ